MTKEHGGKQMDAKTKQAWEYIKTLNYYSQEWGEPLAKLIDTLIENMTVDYQIKERDDFIAGVKKLQEKGWLIGNYECEAPLDTDEEFELDEDIDLDANIASDKNNEDEEYVEIRKKRTNLNTANIKTFFKRWYWIPFKWGTGNLKKDIKSENLSKKKWSDILQFIANTIVPIGAFILAIMQFLKD